MNFFLKISRDQASINIVVLFHVINGFPEAECISLYTYVINNSSVKESITKGDLHRIFFLEDKYYEAK